MADATVDQIAAQNATLAAQNADLQARLVALEARVPAPEPEALAPGVRLEFPRAVYIAADVDAKNIDVPGNEVRIVNSGDELEAAVKEGWKLQPIPAPSKKGKK